MNVLFVSRSICLSAGFVIAICLLAGCGGEAGPKIFPVTGQVTLDGKPLVKAMVQFRPVDGRSSYAETDAEGRFTLSYSARQPGALPGSHQVLITTASETETPASEQQETPQTVFTPEKLPKRYNAESKLTATVEPKKDNVIDFHLTTK